MGNIPIFPFFLMTIRRCPLYYLQIEKRDQKQKNEFQLIDNGFQLINEQTARNSGFDTYQDLESIELTKTLYLRFARVLGVFSGILNIISLFPDAENV
jgi:hypothetical protein